MEMVYYNILFNCRISIRVSGVQHEPTSPRSMQELDQIYGRVGHPTISMLGWGQPDPKPPSPTATPQPAKTKINQIIQMPEYQTPEYLK